MRPDFHNRFYGPDTTQSESGIPIKNPSLNEDIYVFKYTRLPDIKQLNTVSNNHSKKYYTFPSFGAELFLSNKRGGTGRDTLHFPKIPRLEK